jgi:aspartate kinase
MIQEKLKIFKFGGASVRDAVSVANLANILNSYRDEKIIVVISAIDKTTRELAKLTDLYFNKQDYSAQFEKIILKHQSIINELFVDKHSVMADFEKLTSDLKLKLSRQASSNYNFEYDQIVVYGELFSTKIISAYLQQKGFNCRWTDIRNLIKTDSNYRNARVNWQTSKTLLEGIQIKNHELIITQGFIASNAQGLNTTLGIEGSDFTAAIIAYALNAAKVIVWKDVAGFYSSDPKMFDNVVKLDALSFHEAVELAYYGAKIIHPKTIKPLQNKNIPLIVKSFKQPENQGTIIKNSTQNKSGVLPEVPVFITKNNQILISVAPLDFSFIAEENLSDIFALLARFGVKVNLMQNSAISFSVCVDNVIEQMNHLLPELQKNYKVLYNENLTLITIRHYNSTIIETLTRGHKIFVRQKSRNTARFVVK